METISQYHQRKERQEIIETRIIGAFVIICLFIICPMLAHYL
jgi:hypothetical protein